MVTTRDQTPISTGFFAKLDIKAGPATGASKSAGKTELMALLNVDSSVLESSDKGLLVSYQKYLACLQADHTLKGMLANGTWVGKKPPTTDVIELFVSKSMWHSHYTLFEQVPNFPVLKSWLDNGPDAPSDFEVWGYEKLSYNFKDLKDYIATGGGTSSKKEKGKGKAMDTDKIKKKKEGSGSKKDKTKKDKKGSGSKKKAK